LQMNFDCDSLGARFFKERPPETGYLWNQHSVGRSLLGAYPDFKKIRTQGIM